MTHQIPNFTEDKAGVFYDMPDADYRKAPGVSNSMLKAIALDGYEPGSPAHFISQFSQEKEETDALFIGKCVHSRILTPNEPLPGMIAYPETYTNEKGETKPWHNAAKVCKAWNATQEAKGNRPMTSAEIKAMDGIVNAIATNDTCRAIFCQGKAEVSLFKQWHRENGFVLRKARLDWVSPALAIADIKTCQDARAVDFGRVLWQRRYYVQAAYYLDLWNDLNPDDQKTNFVFIAVEKFAPFAIQIFDVDPGDIEKGRWEYKRNLSLIIECMSQGVWPAYPDGIQTIKMKVPFGAAVV